MKNGEEVYSGTGRYGTPLRQPVSQRPQQPVGQRPQQPARQTSQQPIGQRPQQSAGQRPQQPVAQRAHQSKDKRQLKNKPSQVHSGKSMKNKGGLLQKVVVIGKTIAIAGMAGLTIAGATWGLGKINDSIEYGVALGSDNYRQTIQVMDENYMDSEYLQVSMPHDVYSEYTEGLLKEALLNDDMRDCFLKNDLDAKAAAYVLGEYDGSKVSDAQVLDFLRVYSQYVSKDSRENFDFISDIADMAVLSDGINFESRIVSVIRSIIDSQTISNSADALRYKIKLNNEEIERIDHNTVRELQEKCEVNENFEDLAHGKDSTSYFTPYIEDFHNSRVKYVKATLSNPNTPESLRGLLEKYKDCTEIRGCSEDMRNRPKAIMNATKIATFDEYQDYSLSVRNDLYTRILVEKNNPEKAKERLEYDNKLLEVKISDLEVISEVGVSFYQENFAKFLQDVKREAEEHRIAEEQFMKEEADRKELEERAKKEFHLDDFGR